MVNQLDEGWTRTYWSAQWHCVSAKEVTQRGIVTVDQIVDLTASTKDKFHFVVDIGNINIYIVFTISMHATAGSCAPAFRTDHPKCVPAPQYMATSDAQSIFCPGQEKIPQGEDYSWIARPSESREGILRLFPCLSPCVWGVCVLFRHIFSRDADDLCVCVSKMCVCKAFRRHAVPTECVYSESVCVKRLCAMRMSTVSMCAKFGCVWSVRTLCGFVKYSN